MKHIVTSRDGIQFVVDSEERSVQFDRVFAARQPAEVLEKHGDFVRIYDLDLDALLADPAFGTTEAQERALRLAAGETPGPAGRRPVLRLVKGGRS